MEDNNFLKNENELCGQYLFEGVQQSYRASIGSCHNALWILKAQANNSRVNHCGGNAATDKQPPRDLKLLHAALGNKQKTQNQSLWHGNNAALTAGSQRIWHYLSTLGYILKNIYGETLKLLRQSSGTADFKLFSDDTNNLMYYLSCCVSGALRLYWWRWENRLTLRP